ncbi:hypothetical protein ACQV2T_08890 [Facklamia sp. P13069]|uniref:hypothetical protein n=1 Tax=Facklamia sp. P13069 TaxID=3421954 RepID=UPI003D16EF0C
MESINNGRILPICHQLTKKEVAEYSPMLADKKVMITANFTPSEISEELAKVLKVKENNYVMSTTIEINKKSVKDFLEAGKEQKFVIPEYQRF